MPRNAAEAQKEGTAENGYQLTSENTLFIVAR